MAISTCYKSELPFVKGMLVELYRVKSFSSGIIDVQSSDTEEVKVPLLVPLWSGLGSELPLSRKFADGGVGLKS
jgi:hypothetical protein